MPNDSLNQYSLNRYKPRSATFQRPQQAQPQAQPQGQVGSTKTFAQLQGEGQARPAPAPPPPAMPAPVSARKNTETSPPPASAPVGGVGAPRPVAPPEAPSAPRPVGTTQTQPGYKYKWEGERPWWADMTSKDFAGWAKQYTNERTGGKYWNPDDKWAEANQDKLGNGFYIGGEGDAPTFTGYVPGFGGVQIGDEAGWFDAWYNDNRTAGAEQEARYNEAQAAQAEQGAQPQSQSQPTLWQTIMGYYPQLPQNYGWQQGWEKFSNRPQNKVYGAPPQMSSEDVSSSLNPAMSQVKSYTGRTFSNSDADQGTGNPGWPNNGPESPNGEGGTYGTNPNPGSPTPPVEPPPATTPPATTPPTQAPYTPPPSPRGAPTRTSSPWDARINQFATGQNPMFQQLLQAIMGYVDRPSGYDSDMLIGSYNRLNEQLGEDYDVQRQLIKEDMYRRGIADSTIHGGRLGDVATDQARAQSDLAYQLLTDAAQQEQQSRSDSLSMLMNLYGLSNQDQLSRLGLGMSYEDQRFNRWLQEYMMNHQVDQDEIDNWIRLLGL